jgi:metal-responsive CopG/Arc/MetJ family transcriptional regulator
VFIYSIGMPQIKKVKTTIDIPEDLWRKFSTKVIEKHGGRKKNDVIQELLEKYIEETD